MNKIYFLILLALSAFNACAQTQFQQFALGGGAGLAKAYAGADIPNTNQAVYLAATYYPLPVANIELESQFGSFSGSASPNSANKKSFNSTFMAGLADANLYLGVFYSEGASGFLNFIRNCYGGAGYGVISSNINNVQLNQNHTPDHLQNTLRFIPIKAGYEYDIVRNQYGEPLLKATISARFNYVSAKGLDGYYDNYEKSSSFYTFYTVGFKYTFIIRGSGKAYNKLD